MCIRDSFNVDMCVRHEVEAIDAARHVVTVRNLETDEVFEEPYDKLILSPGARPTRPALPGVGLDRLFTLRTVEDTFAMKEFIDREHPRSAVVCGGGFIGLEVAENLRELGLDVTIVQRPRHLMNPFDADAAALIHQEMRAHGVRLALGRSVEGFEERDGGIDVLVAGEEPLRADMVAVSYTHLTASSFNPTCTGDGIKAGLWAGASKDKDAAPMVFDRGAVAPGVDAGYEGEGEGAIFRGSIFQENIGSQPFMKVNRHGQRFANESTPYDFICFAATYQPGGVWCQVYDSNMMDDMLRFETVGCSRVVPYIEMGMTYDEYTAASQEAGILMKADTIEELADMLGFTGQDKDNFLAEVERYNGFYDNQVDEDFGKEAYRLSAIRQPPFYGCWFGGSLLTTIDGLRINENCQVLDPELNVIEGLYAAGDVSGSFFSGNYPEYVVGVACGRSSVEGRHVAKLLAGAAQ